MKPEIQEINSKTTFECVIKNGVHNVYVSEIYNVGEVLPGRPVYIPMIIVWLNSAAVEKRHYVYLNNNLLKSINLIFKNAARTMMSHFGLDNT